jgi:hypothetical protein
LLLLLVLLLLRHRRLVLSACQNMGAPLQQLDRQTDNHR